MAARRERPSLPEQWCLNPGEPAALLPAGFAVTDQRDLPDSQTSTKRQLLARRQAAPGDVGLTAEPGR